MILRPSGRSRAVGLGPLFRFARLCRSEARAARASPVFAILRGIYGPRGLCAGSFWRAALLPTSAHVGFEPEHSMMRLGQVYTFCASAEGASGERCSCRQTLAHARWRNNAHGSDLRSMPSRARSGSDVSAETKGGRPERRPRYGCACLDSTRYREPRVAGADSPATKQYKTRGLTKLIAGTFEFRANSNTGPNLS